MKLSFSIFCLALVFIFQTNFYCQNPLPTLESNDPIYNCSTRCPEIQWNSMYVLDTLKTDDPYCINKCIFEYHFYYRIGVCNGITIREISLSDVLVNRTGGGSCSLCYAYDENQLFKRAISKCMFSGKIDWWQGDNNINNIGQQMNIRVSIPKCWKQSNYTKYYKRYKYCSYDNILKCCTYDYLIQPIFKAPVWFDPMVNNFYPLFYGMILSHNQVEVSDLECTPNNTFECFNRCNYLNTGEEISFLNDSEDWRENFPLNYTSISELNDASSNILINTKLNQIELNKSKDLYNATIRIFNIFGEEVKINTNEDSRNIIINFDNLPVGCYLLLINNSNYYKFIKI